MRSTRPSALHRLSSLGLGVVALVVASCVACRRNPGPFSGVRQPDIVLVTIDTLRWDAPGFSGGARARTANLDRLASRGWTFPDAHAQSVVTLPSHANILTGLYPYQHGVRDNSGFRLDSRVPTLATFLKKAGYATGAFIGAFPLDSRFGLSRDFDVYDERYPEGVHQYDFILDERPATEVVAAARKWWTSAAGRPRFLWVHLYDCHAPYQPPPPFDREYAGAPYYGEVAAVDASLGPLVSDLEADHSPVFTVVTSDHGEALGDHGEHNHGLFAYEATLRVPLLLWSPGHLGHRIDHRPARHIDIAPTILEAAGLPRPAVWPGRSLFSAALRPDEASYFEAMNASLTRGWAPLRGILQGERKYIDLPVPELYDLRSDPGERRNLAETDRESVRRLKNALPAETSRPPAGAVPPEEAARLRNLGYLGGRDREKSSYGPEDDPKNLVGLDSKLHDVVDLYQRKKLPEAIVIAAEIVRARPTMATGYEFLSFLQTRSGDDAAAIRTLEEARRRGLLDEDLTTRLALLYNGIGRPEPGLALLEKLGSSSNPNVWNATGIVRAAKGSPDEALAAFHRALEIDPLNSVAWQNIGLTEVGRARWSEALQAFDHALAGNDHLARAWNGKGVALDNSGREQEAVAAWKKAVSLDPGLLDAWFNLGVVAFDRREEDLARSALSEFVRRAPSFRAEADLRRAQTMLKALAKPASAGVH